ncbi:MAG: hypothetical protein F7C08_00450 [Desulfurococcales archaeon]|nr:hypothetical protein [Desulfurococcales archaeon]MCE4604995.1 hypothetical protein [Desulfurococcales archaeon]
MRKRAARDGYGDRPSLTPTPLVSGTLVIMDLDYMEDYIEKHGLDEYKPNRVTGLLSNLVDAFARKWRGIIVYGLNWERGTEEAVIEIPLVEPSEVKYDLEEIRNEVKREGGSITIVAVREHLIARPARTRREAYSSYRRRAARMLRKLKARGGDTVYIEE